MNLKLIRPIIPVLPVTIILIGLLNTITYYGYFGIHINDFISLNEVVILFADGSILIFFMLLLPFFALVVFSPEMYGYPFDHLVIENSNIYKSKKRQRIISIVLVILLIVACLVGIQAGNYNARVQSVMIIVFVIVVLFFRIVHFMYYSENQKHLPHIYFTITIMFIIITIFTCYLSLVKANAAYYGKYTGTLIQTSDSTIVSDSINIYVGKTNEYIFIHNKLNKSNTAIPFKEVKKITITKRNNK